MRIQYGGNTFCECKVVAVSGTTGVGFGRLEVQLELKSRWAKDAVPLVLALHGDLGIGRPGSAPPIPCARLLPRAGISSPNYSFPHGREAYLSLSADLTYATIEGIEDLRQGGDLTLAVTLNAVLSGDKGVEDSYETVTHHVPQSEWIKVRQSLGHGRTLLLEIPVPQQPPDPRVERTLKHVGAAQQSVLMGDWPGSIAACRKALDSLTDVLGPPVIGDKELQDFIQHAKSATLEDRLTLLRRALAAFCHPAAHGDEVADGISWTRTDALMTVTVLAALLRQLPRMAKK